MALTVQHLEDCVEMTEIDFWLIDESTTVLERHNRLQANPDLAIRGLACF